MKRTVMLGLTVLVVSWSAAMSEEKPKVTEIGGMIFADFLYNGTEDALPAKKSYFEMTRLYISASRQISEKSKVKAVIEGSQPDNKIFVKNAFVEISGVLPAMSVTAGVIPTPWIGYEDKIWRHRFVAKTFTDIEGVLFAADLGAGLKGKCLNKILEYDLTYTNGEGYKTTEDSVYKDISARVGVEPAEGLKIHAYQQMGRKVTDDSDRSRTIGGASYEQNAFSLMGYYLATKDNPLKGSGFSAFGSVKLISWLTALGRFDSYDPNTDTVDNSWNRVIAGVSANIDKDVQLALDVQQKNFENNNIQGKNEIMFFTHLGIKY